MKNSKILKEEKPFENKKKEIEMVKRKNGGLKLLKIGGGVLLVLGGISGFSSYLIQSNFLGVLISAIAFFFGLWLIGQTIE